MQGIKDIKINKDIISIFASGYSILNLKEEDIAIIKENSYTFFINYAPCKFNEKHIDCLIWSDKPVTKWLDTYFKFKPNYLFVSREEAFFKHEEKIYGWLNYMFDNIHEKIKGNYTIVWLIQLIQKYFPEKKILIFGLDSNGSGKWYDEFTSADIFKRGKHYNITKKLNECDQQLEKFTNKKNVFNCNLDSKCKVYEKIDYRDIIN